MQCQTFGVVTNSASMSMAPLASLPWRTGDLGAFS